MACMIKKFQANSSCLPRKHLNKSGRQTGIEDFFYRSKTLNLPGCFIKSGDMDWSAYIFLLTEALRAASE